LRSRFGGEDQRHAVLGVLVAESGEKRVVFAAAENDEFLARFRLQRLRRHARLLSINFSTVAERQRHDPRRVLVEDDAKVAAAPRSIAFASRISEGVLT
jgi:hypothetical protein